MFCIETLVFNARSLQHWNNCINIPVEVEFLPYLHVATATTPLWQWHHILTHQMWLFLKTGNGGYFHSICCPSLSQTGQTALMVASFRGHLPIVERLLAARAKTDLQKVLPIWLWWEVVQPKMKGIEVPNPRRSSACDYTCVIRNRTLSRDSLMLAMCILFCSFPYKVHSWVSDAVSQALCNLPFSFPSWFHTLWF